MQPTASPFRRIHAALRLLPLAFVLVALAGVALAWTSPQGEEAQGAPEEPVAEGPRATPRAALSGFLRASHDRAYEQASRFLDFSATAIEPGSADAAEVAKQLDIVLSREIRIDPALLSDSPDGDLEDGLDPAVERLGSVATERGDVTLLLARADGEWRFAASTVSRIPAIYAARGYGWIEEVLPRSLVEVTFLDIELWQWIALLIAVVLASIAGFLASFAVTRGLRMFTRRSRNEWDDWLLDALAAPLRFGFSVLAFWLMSRALALGVTAQVFFGRLCTALAVAAVTWMVLRAIDVLARVVHVKIAANDASAADTLVPMGRRVTKAFVIVLAGISLIHNLGFNAASLLTGLGVGGLAVALAAQKTLENLFGGIAVIADKPVEVGQFCTVGSHTGTVEEIGLRSTRLRTIQRTRVTVPNAEFSTARIENYAARDRMLIQTQIGLIYDTSPDQIRWILAEVRKLLLSHPRITPDPARIRFAGFGPSSLDLEIFAYVDTRDYNEFLQVREDVLLRILDVVKESGSSFAFPSQTIYLGRDAGLDQDRSKRAEDAVRAWRESGKLPLPDYAPAERESFARSLPYPPEGSVLGERRGAGSGSRGAG